MHRYTHKKKAAFLLPLKVGFTCVQKMLLQQIGKPFAVIFERLVKIGEVMPPRPVVTAVSRFGQVADGDVGAGIVFAHEQGEVVFIRSVKEYDGEPHGIVFEPEARFARL